MGLDMDNASELAIQTLIGTAKLLDTGMPPAKLREMVTSPGGTTAAGLKVFDEKGLKGIVIDALQAAEKGQRNLEGEDNVYLGKFYKRFGKDS